MVQNLDIMPFLCHRYKEPSLHYQNRSRACLTTTTAALFVRTPKKLRLYVARNLVVGEHTMCTVVVYPNRLGLDDRLESPKRHRSVQYMSPPCDDS